MNLTANVNILQAQLEHSELVAPLFDEYRQFYGQASDIPQAGRFMLDRLTKRDSVLFPVLDDEISVGFTQLCPSFSFVSMKHLWILNDLFVSSAARKKGFGAALLERAVQFAVETNSKGLVLETAVNNPAQKLYERLG